MILSKILAIASGFCLTTDLYGNKLVTIDRWFSKIHVDKNNKITPFAIATSIFFIAIAIWWVPVAINLAYDLLHSFYKTIVSINGNYYISTLFDVSNYNITFIVFILLSIVNIALRITQGGMVFVFYIGSIIIIFVLALKVFSGSLNTFCVTIQQYTFKRVLLVLGLLLLILSQIV
jgi:hypothetical protein